MIRDNLKIYSRIPNLIYVVVYMVLLYISYRFFIAPYYGYYNFIFVVPNDLNDATVSLILAFLPSIIFPVHITRPSQLVYALLYFLVYIPIGLMRFYNTNVDSELLITFQLSALFFFFGCLIIWSLPLVSIQPIKLSQSVFMYIYIGFVVFLLALLIGNAGWVLKDIRQIGVGVYETRFAYREVTANFEGILRYATTWLANLMIPLLFLWGWVLNRNVYLMGFSLLIQYFLFSLGNNKSYLGMIFVYIITFSIFSLAPKISGRLISLGFACLLVFSMLMDLALNITPPPINSLVIRRAIMMHGVLTGLYLDYFSQNDLYYLSHGVFSDFVKSSYSFEPANQIGYIFFGNHETSANANIWADAYANFGFVGVVVFNIVLLLYLWILDNSAVNKNQPIIFALTSTTYVLTDTALLTSLLTHGLLVLLAIVILMPTERSSK